MSNQLSATVFFFPDPFGDGQAVTIEAATREEAEKKLEQQRKKHEAAEPDRKENS